MSEHEQRYDKGDLIRGATPVSFVVGEIVIAPDHRLYEVTEDGLVDRGATPYPIAPGEGRQTEA